MEIKIDKNTLFGDYNAITLIDRIQTKMVEQR